MERDRSIGVLLVEDNPGDARLVEIMLSEVETASFQVTHEERLDDALERLKEAEFDVLLLDLSLPDSHGLDTVNRMQAVGPGVPVVVLSGREDEELALEALQLGAEDYLVKGQSEGELIARSIRYSIERRRAKERMAYLTQYDQLTGLANRVLLQDRLEGAVARAGRNDAMVALMFLNLDRFQAVNDTHGEEGGDELLKVVAERLRKSVREGDTVGRVGGDEFAIIAEGIADAHAVVPVAQRILDNLSQPVTLNSEEVFITASLGIAVRPPSEADALLKDAGSAMHRSREQGLNSYRFYTEEMNVRAHERLNLQSYLRRALERQEFILYYQPQVDLKTGRITGAEALLRWQHPEMGLVSPRKFIPILEETGLILPVGEWVLREACIRNAAWRDAGLPPVRVAVNLSARQFEDEGLSESVALVLDEAGLDPSCLELELTESLIMENPEASSVLLGELKKKQGVKVSIDDFGTGYSSLSYLKRFSIDILKIDQSFVRDITTDPDSAAIASTIIGLARSLRMKVIAEGVETREQRDFLHREGCDMAQGYYFSRAVPAEDFVRLLEDERLLPAASS